MQFISTRIRGHHDQPSKIISLRTDSHSCRIRSGRPNIRISKKKHPGTATAQSTDAAASKDKTTSKKKGKKSAKATAAETQTEAAKTPAKTENKKSAPVEAKTAAPEAKSAPVATTEHAAATSNKQAKATPTHTAVSSSEIASAKSKGLVWVNTDSKVYHKDGRYYGNTKQGKFMTEADARRPDIKPRRSRIALQKARSKTNGPMSAMRHRAVAGEWLD